MISLHSSYNPVAQAKRYLDAIPMRQGTRFFILIEPGEGYLVPILNQRFPNIPVIALHVSDSFSSQGNCLSWSPAKGPLFNFLENVIPDIEAGFVHVIEWRPACTLYGKLYVQLLSETINFLKQIDANARTAAVFGARWIKNFFKNLNIIRLACTVPSITASCIITGAGPSLEKVLPLIRGRTAFVIASSSSVPALRSGGIDPDVIITTDGGTWALFHIYECLRGQQFTLAAAMTASLPSQCTTIPVAAIADLSLWQSLILRNLHIPFIALPQRGTVTASAIDFALHVCSGTICIAGVDLAHDDIRTHARPNTFDRLQDEKAARCNPVYSQRFIRSTAIIDGGSLSIYTSWFKHHLELYPRRLHSLGSNNPLFNTLPAWEEGEVRPPHFEYVPVSASASYGKDILFHALEQAGTENTIRRELAPLLFPNVQHEVSVADIKNRLESIL